MAFRLRDRQPLSLRSTRADTVSVSHTEFKYIRRMGSQILDVRGGADASVTAAVALPHCQHDLPRIAKQFEIELLAELITPLGLLA